MNIAIVTNMNGIGLQRDFELLSDFLGARKHSVVGIQYDAAPENVAHFVGDLKFDLAIFLEVIPRNLLELAPIRWAFLNPEFCKPDVIKTAERHIDRVFAKTLEARRIFETVFPGKAYFTGFLTRDQLIPGFEDTDRRPWFLHIGGNSSVRGTQAVLDAWKWKKNGVGMDGHLIVVSSALKERPEIPMVTYYDRVDEEQLKSLQNQCRYHVYPSGTEGFGHAMHESLSVGAIVLTTDAPPMNEMDCAHNLKPTGSTKSCLADVYEVSAIDIHEQVKEILAVPLFQEYRDRSRADFLHGNEEFKTLFDVHLEDITPKVAVPVRRAKGGQLQISFIGNFKADESTERMILWALEEGLGHEVDQLQENEVNLAAIRSAAAFSDLLIWVKTPGWLRVPDREMIEFLDGLKVPSLSIHLDKFFGIPDREPQVGVHPFWKTKYVFTADGSPEAAGFFAARHVNHHWMRPAVSEVYCHPGQPWDMYRCDVGFVGAKEYHGEYPFRKLMVEFLEKTYGDRFKHITGLRGHGLNDFYASCKVTVGDCIFAGVKNYWSDRAPETVGRWGNLLHPNVVGLSIPCWVYKPQDLENLHFQIERILQQSDKLRKDFARHGAEWIRQHDTWTIRMKEILEVVRCD